jgi:stage II sporulation protein D
LSDGSTRTGFTSLPSACFAVTEADGSTLCLTGGGFGHGIGMSQYGANAMGKAGLDYCAILEAYYPGAEITLE